MPVTDRQRIDAVFLLLLFVFAVFGMSKAFANVPPEYVELTSAEMKSRGFTFKIDRYNDHASIELKFPSQLRGREAWLVPLYTYVVIKNKSGEVIASTTNWVVKNDTLTIVSSYNTALSDLSIAIDYGCPITGSPGFGCGTTFRIASVSKFFDENPDAINLPLKCRKVPGYKLEILDCTG